MLEYLAADYNYHMFGIGVLNESLTNFTYALRFSHSPRHKNDLIQWDDWKTKSIFPTFDTLGPRDKTCNFGGSPGKLV